MRIAGVELSADLRLESVEWAKLPGERLREAGRNARLGVHGKYPEPPVAVVRIGGIVGFGLSFIRKETAEGMIGTPVYEFFEENGAVKEPYRSLEFPLLDWLGKAAGKPVYDLFRRADAPSAADGVRIPCYDTSLYFDDLHMEDDPAAAEWMRREAEEGKSLGHRHFKIKVGRGARWMDPAAGLKRDIAVIRAVAEVAGPEGKVTIDANNGYTLNQLKEVLRQTPDLYWVEEAFHEDRVLYEDLREWMAKHDIRAMIADGEGDASPHLMDWAQAGVVDVVQYDIIVPGFSAWLGIGAKLDQCGVLSAPHSYGTIIGNYVGGHLAGAIRGFQFVEWDEGDAAGVDRSAYRVEDGAVTIPNLPGFGLGLDLERFAKERAASGWRIG